MKKDEREVKKTENFDVKLNATHCAHMTALFARQWENWHQHYLADEAFNSNLIAKLKEKDGSFLELCIHFLKEYYHSNICLPSSDSNFSSFEDMDYSWMPNPLIESIIYVCKNTQNMELLKRILSSLILKNPKNEIKKELLQPNILCALMEFAYDYIKSQPRKKNKCDYFEEYIKGYYKKI